LGNFIVRMITNATVAKYGYGYKFSQTRIKRQKILLPTSSQGEPDFDFMENYMKQLELKKLKKYLEYKEFNYQE